METGWVTALAGEASHLSNRKLGLWLRSGYCLTLVQFGFVWIRARSRISSQCLRGEGSPRLLMAGSGRGS